MDYYELAEQVQVYPEWEPVWVIDPQENRAFVVGAIERRARLVDPSTLELGMSIFDAVPRRKTSRAVEFGTIETAEYEIAETGARFLMSLRPWTLTAPLDQIVASFFEHRRRGLEERRPQPRAPDGWRLLDRKHHRFEYAKPDIRERS